MLINVHCPRCNRLYHLEETLRGQRICCPNPGCREIFEVREDGASAAGPAPAPVLDVENIGLVPIEGEEPPPEESPAVPPGGRHTAGAVGDLVPIVPSEPAVRKQPPPVPERQERRPPPAAPNVADLVTLLPSEAAYTSPPESRQRPAPFPPTPSSEKKKHGRKTKRHHSSGTTVHRGSEAPPGRRKTGTVPDPEATEEMPAVEPAKRAPETVKIIPSTPFEIPPNEASPQAPSTAEQPATPGPIELSPGAWEAPPVRQTTGDNGPTSAEMQADHLQAPAEEAAPEDEAFEEDEREKVMARRKRSILATIGLSVFVAALVGGVVLVMKYIEGKHEEELYTQAKSDYATGKYLDATKKFQELDQTYPESEDKPSYHFFAGLSEIRDLVFRFEPQLDKGGQVLQQFLKEHKGQQLLKDKRQDIWETCSKLIEGFTASARTQLDVASPNLQQVRQTLDQAKHWQTEATNRFGSEKLPRETLAKSAKAMDDVAALLARAEERARVLAVGRSLPPSYHNYYKYKDTLRSGGWEGDPECMGVAEEIWNRVVANIRYCPFPPAPPPKPLTEEPSLIVVPAIGPRSSLESDHVIFGLCRGVLYVMSEKDGRLLWTTRVGIDTFALPVRLPATESAREAVLVLSSDTNTLTARDAHTGEVRWTYNLQAPCLGRPLLVDQRLFVPTYDGKVHEIDVAQGHLLGWYELGMPMTVGGVREEGTDLLYFPAESRVVFVLDVRKGPKRLPYKAILKSEHPAGSLRSEPIIISRAEVRGHFNLDPSIWPDYLVLNQTDGLDHMKMRVFTLPITNNAQAPELFLPMPPIQGWSWFPPFQDPEKVVQVTDAGRLAVIGIKQVRNFDDPLFLQSDIPIPLSPGASRSGRAQLVYAVENDFWILANGDLQLWHFDLFNTSKDKLTPLWPRALPLGSPLQASQVDEETKTLFLVTQALTQQKCLASAVNVEDGSLVWQRQLGLVCQGDPVILQNQVMALDQGGALLLFDPKRPLHPLNGAWVSGGQMLAKPMDEGSSVSSLVLSPDGQSAYQITTVEKTSKIDMGGYKMIVRRYGPGQAWFEKTFQEWPAPLRGTPAADANSVLLPLADGSIWRQVLDQKTGTQGPTWRAPAADVGAHGYVMTLGNDDFLTTDGSGGLKRFHWPLGDANFKQVGETLRLHARIVDAPLLLPRYQEHPDVRVLLADADGIVHLVQFAHTVKGDLFQEIRSWDLPKITHQSELNADMLAGTAANEPWALGQITAGPYWVGQRVACILDHRRLVLLDMGKDGMVWQYVTAGEGIVGHPQLVGDMLVVADRRGSFVGLDAANGRPRWEEGYTLKANVAPAAAPVAFGKEVAFAPLTDGTVFLLPLPALRPPR